jgi:hypothetical protein
MERKRGSSARKHSTKGSGNSRLEINQQEKEEEHGF